IGAGLQDSTLHALINVLDFGLDPQAAADAPASRGPYLSRSGNPDAKPNYSKEAVGRGEFSEAVLDGVRARGQPLQLVGAQEPSGCWAGIHIDRANGKLTGGTSGKFNGIVEGLSSCGGERRIFFRQHARFERAPSQ